MYNKRKRLSEKDSLFCILVGITRLHFIHFIRMKNYVLLLILFVFSSAIGQVATEKIPPSQIKSVYFSKGNQALVPIFKLGEVFIFNFDDLNADQSDYYFQIKHFNKDWTPSQLSKTEYLKGLDDQRIRRISNSVNTLQSYTHYEVSLPSSDLRFLVSGNYMISIYDADHEEILSRKFVLYEEQININVLPKRTRDASTTAQKQTVNFSYDFGNGPFLNPRENFKVTVLQNGRWDEAITQLKPQYTIGTQFTYQYDVESQFWAGNEYWYFDNSDIMLANNMIAKVTSDTGIFNTYLYPFVPRLDYYTFYNDTNGSFEPRNKHQSNGTTAADYAWVYFSLAAAPMKNQVYVVGLFNNYQLSDENRLTYDSATQMYQGALLLKQGYTSYRIVSANGQKIQDSEAIDGNFFETENDYQVLLYYRGGGSRYDRIVGFGQAKSINITN